MGRQIQLVGFHESSCRIAFSRLQIGSKKAPHSFGHGDSPNVRQRYRRIRSLAESWVQHWIAVAAERLHCRNANLKSALLAMICLWGLPVGILASCGNGPVDESFEAGAIYAWH